MYLSKGQKKAETLKGLTDWNLRGKSNSVKNDWIKIWVFNFLGWLSQNCPSCQVKKNAQKGLRNWNRNLKGKSNSSVKKMTENNLIKILIFNLLGWLSQNYPSCQVKKGPKM